MKRFSVTVNGVAYDVTVEEIGGAAAPVAAPKAAPAPAAAPAPKAAPAGANAVTGDFSIESAGFMIRDGKKAEAVKSFTVAGNFYELLKKIEEALAEPENVPTEE